MSLIDTVLRAMGLKSDPQSARSAVEAVAIWLRVKGHENAAHDLTLEDAHKRQRLATEHPWKE